MKNLAHNSLGLLFWLFFLLGPGLPLQAQDDDNEQKIHLKVIKEKDGVEEVYEKTYDSKEALLNDEKLKELNVDVKKFEGGLMLQKQNGKQIIFMDEGNKDRFQFHHGFDKFGKNAAEMNSLLQKKFKVFADSSHHFIFKDSGNFVFNTPHDSIFRNLKMYNFNSDSIKWLSFDHDSLFLKVDSLVQHNLDNFKMYRNFNFDSMKVHLDTSFFKLKEFFSDEGFNMPQMKFFEENGNVFQLLDSLGTGHHFNFFSPGQEGDDVKIYIRTLGDKTLTIRDIGENDEALEDFNLKKGEELSTETLSYFPNPSSGAFTLQYKGDAEKELQVHIYDLDGKEIYREILTDFSGNYNQQINLTDQLKGTYILQVSQGNKMLHKKIIIE